MQKAFSLEQHELLQIQQFEAERSQVLNRFALLTLEMEGLRVQLPRLEQQQRSLVGMAVARVGVDRYQRAWIEGPNLMLELPDEAPAAPSAPKAPMVPARVNGPEAVARKE